jgi:hypothetical protein
MTPAGKPDDYQPLATKKRNRALFPLRRSPKQVRFGFIVTARVATVYGR